MKEGGWPTFWRNVITLLSLPLALPAVLIIRLIRPFVVIRFGTLMGRRIGHFAANTEISLCERDAGINVPRQPFVDIWYHMPFICNIQLKRMWDRTMNVWPAAVVKPVDRLNRFLPWNRANVIQTSARDIHNVLERFPPHLYFLPEEEEQGQSCLKAMGIPQGANFVCFHSRDPEYLRSIYPRADNNYHHDYRDSDICSYIVMAEELTRRGYYAIRMGAVVNKALDISNFRIIDYASNGHRSDFTDIYLGAKCTFFVTSGTGIDAIPHIFRRPLVGVNYVPLEYVCSWKADHIAIFKKHWLRKEHRFMTFREILDSGAGRFANTQQFDAMDIELIENTPEEITAAAIEMDERLKGTWQSTEDDEELQCRFWSLYKPNELHGKIKFRIGTEFLRNNLFLLG